MALSDELHLLVDMWLSADSRAIELMKMEKVMEMFNCSGNPDVPGAADFIRNIDSWANMDENTYELEIEPRVSARMNSYFILREYRWKHGGKPGGRSDRNRYERTSSRLLNVIRKLEVERDSATEKYQRLKTSYAEMMQRYTELESAYRSELADANRMRTMLGIPESVDNILQFRPVSGA